MHTTYRARAVRLAALLLGFAAPAVAVEPSFEVCTDRFPFTPLTRVILALNAEGARLDAITAEGFGTAGDLEKSPTWDFSPATSGGNSVVQVVPADSMWSCSVGRACGSLARADALLVEDDLVSGRRDVNAIDYDSAASVFLRAQLSGEGESDELRVCFAPDVTFLRFPGPGNCARDGDPGWTTPFSCARGVTPDDPCGSASPAAGLDGRIDGKVVRSGTLTLPSGHVLDALLVEVFADLTAQALLFGTCAFEAGAIQQYLLLWLVPEYGPIAQLSGPPGITDLSWSAVGTTTLGYGLLPPVDTVVDSVSDTSISVSWSAGGAPGFIGPGAFVVHWGESEGRPSTTSEDRGDTIPGSASSYTITGLTPGTRYCSSVSTRYDYTDPVSGLTTPYRSISRPRTIGADVDGDGVRDHVYPVEVCASTSGTPPPLPLLRDAAVTDVSPGVTPPLFTVLPLDPMLDVYVMAFVPGDVDPEVDVLTDPEKPLVFYGYPTPRTLRAVKTPGAPRRVKIE